MKNKDYKTIGEVAKEISINTHTLRFWEKEFKQIKPKILSGQRRYYTTRDVNILRLIYELLKNQGYTIAGAKKLLNNQSIKLALERIVSDTSLRERLITHGKERIKHFSWEKCAEDTLAVYRKVLL